MVQSSLTELDAVLMVARQGKFRTAALELGVSTTALSNAVGKLERTLGVRLFNRTTRSVSLTEAGRQFVAQVERIAPGLGFLLYTYCITSPLPYRKLGLKAVREAWTPRNFPPASVWRYRPLGPPAG